MLFFTPLLNTPLSFTPLPTTTGVGGPGPCQFCKNLDGGMCGGVDDVRGGSKWYVKSVFIVHVGGTRCVTSSTDHIMKIHARITFDC